MAFPVLPKYTTIWVFLFPFSLAAATQEISFPVPSSIFQVYPSLPFQAPYVWSNSSNYHLPISAAPHSSSSPHLSTFDSASLCTPDFSSTPLATLFLFFIFPTASCARLLPSAVWGSFSSTISVFVCIRKDLLNEVFVCCLVLES